MRFLGLNIGDCAHTEGLYKAARIAKMAGFETYICKPNTDYDEIFKILKQFEPDYIGLSYRLSPDKGYSELKKFINTLSNNGLLINSRGTVRKIAFAGLPKTISIIKSHESEFPCRISLIKQTHDLLEQVFVVFDFLELNARLSKEIVKELREEMFPPQIELLSQLADHVIENDNYWSIEPLPIPSENAKKDYVVRMKESKYPMIRSHFGIPDESIRPTVEGIRLLANARVLDELSIGSSDLSQRYYGNHEEFKNRKNDGGVPYKDLNDLRELFLASRTGNFPSCKPYAHTTGILNFIDDCIKTGHLIGAHQAIPLFWFNQLDGRGSTTVEDSIKEHVAAVKKLASLNIPVEMNDPNQWSSRWAHDSIIVTDYALISSVMLENNVRNMIFQMQFNKPVETSDYGDIAKFKASSILIEEMRTVSGKTSAIFHESRTGIESFSTDLKQAKKQLARSTLLQMILNPSIIHLVSYCEAVRAATVEDIIESSKIIRKAVDVFKKYEYDLRRYETDALVLQRIEFLLNESRYLSTEIAKLDKDFNIDNPITTFLCKPSTIYKSILRGYMAAPGITNPEFKNETLLTKPMKNGFFNAVDFTTNEILFEQNRINLLTN